jgi:tetratricopeptide (TPR) repeat protein/predicted Ser/Thr protein kinase
MSDRTANDPTILQPRDRSATGLVAEKLAQARAEQRRDWQAGRRVLAEAYLEQFPELAEDVGAVVDLVSAEYSLRTELDDDPQVDEFTQRFPRHADIIRDRLEEPTEATEATKATLPLPAGMEGTATAVPARPVREGKRPIAIPGYEILGELGRGAMGVVYRTRQKGLGREVAVKMVLSGQFAGPHELERFRSEAVQLAKLQHPNIVQVFEVGECDGRPFFAMEYVPGGSLARLLGKKPMPAQQAAELAETLARAMHHAHERGIIHRDLKPANILLAADGSPKVTDFGLAKGGGSAADTGTFAVLGTPSYMAPEQAGGRSRDVGPAADVYALGAILYECLTGRPPFRAPNWLDTVHLVATAEPVAPGALTSNLPPDLETITLKCLQKEPAKRYASAAAQADDLRRFLDGRPIVARPVSAWEKCWKWARRRPAWAALIVTVVIATAALVAGGVWFNTRLRQERDLAVANARLAEERFQLNRQAVDQYFTEVSETNLLDEPGLEPLRESLLKRAREYYARFVAERRNDPAVRADFAGSLGRLARITADLKDPQQAIAMYQESLPILDDLAADHPADPARRAQIATTWYELSKLYRLTNQAAAAAAACTSATAEWNRLTSAFPDRWQYRAELARSLISQSNLDFKLGHMAAARATCEQALAMRRKLAAEHPADEGVGRDLATTWDNLANIRAADGQREASLEARQQAERVLSSLVAAHPYRSLYRHDLARTEFNLATASVAAGQPQAAAASLRDAASQWDRLHALYPAVRDYQVSWGNALFALSGTEWSLGKRKEADESLAQATAVRASLVKEYPGVAEYVVELARCDAAAGDRARQRGQPGVAVDAFRRAVDRVAPIAEKYPNVPGYRADLARHLLNLGGSEVLAGRLDDARSHLNRAFDLWSALKDDVSHRGDAEVQVLSCVYALGDLERRAGKPTEALEWFDRDRRDAEALARKTPAPPGASGQLRNAWWGTATTLTALERYPEAMAAWDDAIALTDADNLLFMKLYRLATLARTSECEQSLVELDPLAVQARTSGEALVNVARVYALAAATTGADRKRADADRHRRASEIARRAVENLDLARLRDGFADPAARDDLDKNKDWESLRDRADFQKLLAGLAAVKP